jgi:hypothetical protein
MLIYVANFSFELDASAAEFRSGHATAIVAAEGPVDAFDKLRALLREKKDDEPLFEPVITVYLHSLAEMPSAPTSGAIVFAQLIGDGGSITTKPIGRGSGVTTYEFGGTDTDDERPFVEF